MNGKMFAAGLALALIAVPGSALAGHGNGNGQGHDSYPGFADEATYGLCMAYENNENGRENGQAGEAPPFQELEDRAEENDQTVEEYCAEHGQHPGGDNSSERGQGQDNRP